MIATGRVAFANARVRAMKSRLLGHEIAGRVLAGLRLARDERLEPARGRNELIDWYITVLASYPRGGPLFLAMLRRHEIENIKLLWRVIVNNAGDTPWRRHWIDLGALASFAIAAVDDCRSLPALADALVRTPYATVAHDMWRAHAGDPAAAEHGFDRWASACITNAAGQLPAADRTAADIATTLVRERDLNIARRLHTAGLPAPAITLPRSWRRHAPGDDERLLLWLRRKRKLLCRRAFLETPFCVAPGVALLMLKEEEIRGLEAIHSFDPSSGDAAWLDYALAASELGA